MSTQRQSNTKLNATMALVMGTLAMVVSFMAWSSLAPIANQVSTQFDLSVAQKNFLIATPVLLGSVMRIPMGIFSDKYGGKKVYILLMLFSLIPLFMIPHVHSYGALIFSALLLGMIGTSFAVSISYVSVWFPPEKQGAVLGITGMGNIGNAVAALVLPTIAKSYQISGVYYFLIGLMILMIILFAVLCKEMPVNKDKSFKEALSVAKEKDTWYLALFYFLTFGVFVSLSNLLPSLLTDQFAVDPVQAGLWAAAFAAVCTCCRPLGGVFADKVRPMTLLKWCFVGLFAGALVLTFLLNSFVGFALGILVVAVFAGLGNGIVFKMVPYVSESNTGAVTGFVGAAGGLGGYFPPIVLGVIKQATGSYQFGFIFLAIFIVICLFVLWKVFIKDNERIVK